MTDILEEDYSEAAPYIKQAVDEHGEEWVLENYYQKLYPLGQVMKMPEKEDLPFYHSTEHDAMTDAERVEMYQAWAEYRENHVDVDEENLREQAPKYGLEDKIDALLRYLETHGKVDNDRLPEWDEFQELEADYEVRLA